jgi:hypothetical protein
MPHYRVYLLGENGRIVSATEAVFENDDDAFTGARRTLTDSAKAEIWSGVRCVGRVSAPLPNNNIMVE